VQGLLDAAGELDAAGRLRNGKRRALIATLTVAGLRLGEALDLRWRDLDLARGTITVRAAKTDAGVRTVNVPPILRDELDAYRPPVRRRIRPTFGAGCSRRPWGRRTRRCWLRIRNPCPRA
jgi:integrase